MPFGRWWHFRGKPGRAPQHAQAYRGTLYRVSKHHIRRGRREGQSSTDQGNPCTRESNAQTGGFLRGKLISDHGLFSSYESQQGGANGQDSRGVFQGCAELWKAGCWIAPASPAQGLDCRGPRYYIFSYFCMTRPFRNLGLFVKTDWNVICPFVAESAGHG